MKHSWQMVVLCALSTLLVAGCGSSPTPSGSATGGGGSGGAAGSGGSGVGGAAGVGGRGWQNPGCTMDQNVVGSELETLALDVESPKLRLGGVRHRANRHASTHERRERRDSVRRSTAARRSECWLRVRRPGSYVLRRAVRGRGHGNPQRELRRLRRAPGVPPRQPQRDPHVGQTQSRLRDRVVLGTVLRSDLDARAPHHALDSIRTMRERRRSNQLRCK